jgi:hypothetical protein
LLFRKRAKRGRFAYHRNPPGRSQLALSPSGGHRTKRHAYFGDRTLGTLRVARVRGARYLLTGNLFPGKQILMGKQYNKLLKRRRRLNYLKRKHKAAKA